MFAELCRSSSTALVLQCFGVQANTQDCKVLNEQSGPSISFSTSSIFILRDNMRAVRLLLRQLREYRTYTSFTKGSHSDQIAAVTLTLRLRVFDAAECSYRA